MLIQSHCRVGTRRFCFQVAMASWFVDSPVIDTLAKGLDILLNHKVAEIVRHRNKVDVTVSSGKTFVADAAVVAVPLGVLKANTIKFEPRLPEWKEGN
ncbi:unnamed protein product [Urochloa humidicola]